MKTAMLDSVPGGGVLNRGVLLLSHSSGSMKDESQYRYAQITNGRGSIDLPSNLTGGRSDDTCMMRVNRGKPTNSLAFPGLISAANYHSTILIFQ